jgi:hypothetical protein
MRHPNDEPMRAFHRSLGATALFCALIPNAQTQSDVTVGSTYDIVRSVELRDGPGPDHEKKINQKASDSRLRIEYMSVDSSTTVTALEVKGDWVEVQVVEPKWLADTHRGWIPISALKRGKATQKRDGWIAHTCFVYLAKDTKSKRVGYLQQRAAVSVNDDGSGWLELPTWAIKPVKDMKTNDFLSEAQMKRPMYIETSNFTGNSTRVVGTIRSNPYVRFKGGELIPAGIVVWFSDINKMRDWLTLSQKEQTKGL